MTRISRIALAIALSLTQAYAHAREDAQSRFECVMFGDDYPINQYPDGAAMTWWVEDDMLRQASIGTPASTVPGLAWKRIVRWDEQSLLARWGNDTGGSSSYSWVVDLTSGTVEERTYSDLDKTQTMNVGTCVLLSG